MVAEWTHGKVRLAVGDHGYGVLVGGGVEIELTSSELRWLVTTAGPAALAIVAPLATGRQAQESEPVEPDGQTSLLG